MQDDALAAAPPALDSAPASESRPPAAPPSVTPAEAAADGSLGITPQGLLFARPAEPMLLLHQRDPRRFVVATPWHEFSGDLSQGLVLQAIRGPGGAPGSPVCHSGNILEYRHRGRTVSLDVEAHIVDWGIIRQPRRAILFHESAFRGPQGMLGRARPLARLRYEYVVAAESPVLALTVTLVPEPGVVLPGLRVTTALDAMSPETGTHAVRRAVAFGADGRRAVAAMPGSSLLDLHRGAAESLLFPEESRSADDAAPPQEIRLLLGDGHLLAGAKASLRPDGALHWAVLRYGGRTLPRGARLVLREERIRLPAGSGPGGGTWIAPDARPAQHALPSWRWAASR